MIGVIRIPNTVASYNDYPHCCFLHWRDYMTRVTITFNLGKKLQEIDLKSRIGLLLNYNLVKVCNEASFVV